jgi:hypothetical protein
MTNPGWLPLEERERIHDRFDTDQAFFPAGPRLAGTRGVAADLTLRGNICDCVEVYLGSTKWRDVAGTALRDLQIARALLRGWNLKRSTATHAARLR